MQRVAARRVGGVKATNVTQPRTVQPLPRAIVGHGHGRGREGEGAYRGDRAAHVVGRVGRPEQVCAEAVDGLDAR